MSTLQLVTAQPVVRICANPGCEKRIKENPKGGRPRRYCNEACKRANAAKVRSARSRISQNRASLAEQSRAAGLGEIPSPAEVKSTMESLHAVADNLADASQVLRAHTRDWAVWFPVAVGCCSDALHCRNTPTDLSRERSYVRPVPELPERTARRRRQLGDTIRTTRLAAGLTQEKTALAAGLDRSFYVEVETGKHSHTVDRLFAIADALNVPAARLIDGIV